MRLLLCALLLAGCVSSAPDNPAHRTYFFGIPLVLAKYSSGTQVTGNHAVVTKHAIDTGASYVMPSRRYDAALISQPGTPAKFGRAVLGETVRVYGTNAFGATEIVTTRVIEQRLWACDGPLLPDVHTEPGSCTRAGKGYSYGFAVEQGNIRPGFSGGGAYNARGELLGIVVQVGTDTKGRDIAFLYHIADLREDLGF